MIDKHVMSAMLAGLGSFQVHLSFFVQILFQGSMSTIFFYTTSWKKWSAGMEIDRISPIPIPLSIKLVDPGGFVYFNISKCRWKTQHIQLKFWNICRALFAFDLIQNGFSYEKNCNGLSSHGSGSHHGRSLSLP